MSRITIFLLILVLAIMSVISSLATFLPHEMMMTGISGKMGGSGVDMMSPFWPLLMTASMTLIVVAVAYVIAFPTIEYTTEPEGKQEDANATELGLDPMDIVMRVTKPDERAALEVLKSSGGICLQKDITYKTRLSKLKTHRIVARLAEREIVQVRKVGKTNEITVPPWLKGQRKSVKPAPNATS